MSTKKPTTKVSSLKRLAGRLDDSENTKNLMEYQSGLPKFPWTKEQTLDRAVFRSIQGEKLFQVALSMEGQT
jgi:hypothetical protein